MCFTRKKHNIKKKLNRVYPSPIPDYKDIHKEKYICGFCNKICNNKEIKIYCDGCEKFYHCNVAGSCTGEDCTHKLPNGKIHSSRYCINCVNKNTIDNGKCLCTKCDKNN